MIMYCCLKARSEKVLFSSTILLHYFSLKMYLKTEALILALLTDLPYIITNQLVPAAFFLETY